MEERAKTIFCFDAFEVDTLKRKLLKGGEVVHLKPKAFDLLLTLIEHRTRVLSKNDLLDLVWENQFIEENESSIGIRTFRTMAANPTRLAQNGTHKPHKSNGINLFWR